MLDWASVSLLDGSSLFMKQAIFFYDHLMSFVLLITILAMCLVLTQMSQQSYAQVELNPNKLEIMWTMAPVLVLVMMAFPSIQILYLSEAYSQSNLSFKVGGNQWFWSYAFGHGNLLINFDSYMSLLEAANSFRLLDSDNFIMLPHNSSVRALVSATDVIHSWAIPSAGLKVDAVPGRINQAVFTFLKAGVYYGQCSEICGANHSFMPISILVK